MRELATRGHFTAARRWRECQKQAHPQWETCSGVGTVCLDSVGPERDEGHMEEMICGIDETKDVQEVSIS